ncbi:mitochondrial inner membrane protease subunit 2-like [Tubulanus polymorphus]|uniref:mitochondrial inner membrane protease subunit 2-like n=1 Tax=Tubulanus polymorphus TaxID=672921 RepID=UPI003DA2590A
MTSIRYIQIFFGSVTFAIPVSIACMDIFGYVAKVEGSSMQPVLNPKQQMQKRSPTYDYVLLNKWKARNYDVNRGEIVSLISPNNSDQKIIKRIIGLQGDVVSTLHYKTNYVKIPDGQCWIEGDHHGQSLDSNYFGTVPITLIQAKATHIVWPPSRWSRLQSEARWDRVFSRIPPEDVKETLNSPRKQRRAKIIDS